MLSWIYWFVALVDQHSWLITIIVGSFVFLIYRKGRNDSRRDAAKLILQEMRYADQKVRNYRTYSSYNFTEKILPTNSWNKNINLFIRALTESELDLISKFFSSAAYLDDVIKAIANSRNNTWIGTDTPITISDGAQVAMGTGGLSENEPAKKLIEAISKDIESVYNTPAADKLRKISENKWYSFNQYGYKNYRHIPKIESYANGFYFSAPFYK